MRVLILFLSLTAHTYAMDMGVHLFKVQFGSGVIFNDILILEENSKGSFTVPGVFTVPVIVQSNQDNFSFLLKASEGNNPFSFIFKGTSNEGLSEGEIFDETTGNKIGSFKGEKIYDL